MIKTTALAMFIAFFSISAQDRPAERQKNQKARIDEGVQSGELTKKEAHRLRKKEARVRRQTRRDRKDGGGLTPAERAKAEAKQDALSADIAKQKHDTQTRK